MPKLYLPNKEGEYLFYFGGATQPYYQVDTLRLTCLEDVAETEECYLENNTLDNVTFWWELPNVGRAGTTWYAVSQNDVI